MLVKYDRCTDCKFPYSLPFYGPLSPALSLRLEPVGSSSDTGKIKIPKRGFLILVALVGLEPTLLAELDFESSASTNSATGPWHQKAIIMLLSLLQLFLPNVHCGLPCVQAFLQVQQVFQPSFQWLF